MEKFKDKTLKNRAKSAGLLINLKDILKVAKYKSDYFAGICHKELYLIQMKNGKIYKLYGETVTTEPLTGLKFYSKYSAEWVYYYVDISNMLYMDTDSIKVIK